MSEFERIALAIAVLTAQVAQLSEDVKQMHREVQDCMDVYRNCACFGAATTEVP